jgi:hypothetical protein
MYSFETLDLSTYRGDDYFLAGFVEPDPSEEEDYDPDNDADEYGVTLVREASHPLEDNIEIVRMDTAHDQPHLDKEYLPPDADEEKKIWLDHDYSYGRMKEYLLANWKSYVDYYIHYNE